MGSGSLHFDKDEGAASMKQKMILPMRSTVTYLTAVGSPTAVFNAEYRAGPIYDVEEVATEAWIVFPSPNKHISFQGDLYHGIFQHVYPDRRKDLRATLLVNYWSTKPLSPYCVPFPMQTLTDFDKFADSIAHPPVDGLMNNTVSELPIVQSSGHAEGSSRLKRFRVPCDTSIREDYVWLPEEPPPRAHTCKDGDQGGVCSGSGTMRGHTYHVQWPKQYWTERMFHHLRKSRFAGQPVGKGKIGKEEEAEAVVLSRGAHAEALLGEAYKAKGVAAAVTGRRAVAAKADLQTKMEGLVEVAIAFDEVEDGVDGAAGDGR
jgi:hypothetical protein